MVSKIWSNIGVRSGRKELDKASSKTLTKEAFLSVVRKYTRAKKLTPEMLNALIDHIEVNQAEKVNGVWEQRVTIYYNVVGPIIIPEDIPLPVPDVTVNTRRGVNVSYAGA